MSDMDEQAWDMQIPPTPTPTPTPPLYEQIAALVAGYVDDRLAEFEHRYNEEIPVLVAEVMRPRMKMAKETQRTVERMQGTMAGLRDAVAKLYNEANESMPEHVYKQFIRSEAERLRIVKPRREPESPSSTTDPDSSQ